MQEPLILSKFSPARKDKLQDQLFAGDVIRLLHIDTEGFI